MIRKGAVVIGVNKTGGLPALQSAASGAKDVAEWLESEGYKVVCLTDQNGPVLAQQVWNAVAEFVTVPSRYSLLVVYFSGHGTWHTKSDHWLLSGAPVQTTEAINLRGAMEVAEFSGIPNVVFISDACRSIPDTRSGAKVDGIDAFPNYSEITASSKIDCFKATAEALAAYEVVVNGVAQSVLTSALKSAFDSPEPSMVREIAEGGGTVRVVPNRRLEIFLQNKVNALLASVNPGLTQTVQANVPSSDDVYIARVRAPPAPAGAAPRPGAPPLAGPPSGAVAPRPTSAPVPMAPGADSAATISRSLSTRGFARGALGAELVPAEQRTERAVLSRLPDRSVDHFETHTGFVVSGAALAEALYAGPSQEIVAQRFDTGAKADVKTVLRLQRKNTPLIPLEQRDSGSVALVLTDGRCAVVPCLSGFIGHALFDDSGLANVSFIPSSNTWRWAEYAANRDYIDRLRAMAAIALDHEAFQLRSNREASALAANIRIMKGLDPTLGLYAAVAYAQAGNEQELQSVCSIMRNDLGADLFDIGVFTMRRGAKTVNGFRRVPFCPMLTQTWNVLRPRGIVLPKALQEARPFLCNSLWTTFWPSGASAVIDAIKAGELQ
jgi:hypothetical protein